MRYRLAPLLAALALLGACGGDDSDDSDDGGDEPTTTTAAAEPTPVADGPVIARIVVQIDDQLRPLLATARPCIQSDAAACTGEALKAYQQLDDLAGATDLLNSVVTEGASMYSGELDPSLAGRFDETLNLGTTAREASEAAQAACLPDFGAGCAEANAALDAALIDLLKNFNAWRREL